MKYKKRMLSVALAASLAMSALSGCSNGLSKDGTTASGATTESAEHKDGRMTKEEASKTLAMHIGDYDVYMDELLVYAMQAIVVSKLTPDICSEANQKSVKQTALSYVRTTKIEYDAAVKAGVTLTDNDKASTKTLIDNFKNSFPQKVFDDFGISDEVIEKVFTEQTYVQKFENDTKNEIGQAKTKEKQEEFADYNFHNIYYMIFPTVEQKNGAPATASDGSYRKLPEDKQAEAKANAEKLIERVKAGEDVKKLAEEFGITSYSSERSGYVGAYSDELNEAIKDLEAGEISGVVEGELGYVVVYMMTAHDEDIKKLYVDALVSDLVDQEFSQKQSEWLNAIPVDVNGDMEGTVWEDYDLYDLCKEMNDK